MFECWCNDFFYLQPTYSLMIVCCLISIMTGRLFLHISASNTQQQKCMSQLKTMHTITHTWNSAISECSAPLIKSKIFIVLTVMKYQKQMQMKPNVKKRKKND